MLLMNLLSRLLVASLKSLAEKGTGIEPGGRFLEMSMRWKLI